GAMCVLVLIEPNLSITICIALLLFAYLIAGGLKTKYILMFCGLGLLMLPILIIIEPYRLLRLFAFLDPWASPKGEGYQLIQSLYSIANGGLFGVGYLNSRQALRFLPFSESDFIFPIIAEEFGLFGCVIVIACFFEIILIGFRKAFSADNLFSSYLAFGISTLIAIQTVINIAVVSGAIPPTGLPLPLISSGNTQIIMFLSELGILINISKRNVGTI
ncbi:MAG: FtsW/RodA/SpoVE family cell cycle protein, partial [Clostridia bacterium]